MMVVIVKGSDEKGSRMVSDAKARMIEGAARLLAEKGLQETSFSEVVALTGAPRGSIYHHFPGGKASLVAQALDFQRSRSLAVIESARGRTAVEVASTFLEAWRRLLLASHFTIGCSAVAVAVAADSDDLLQRSGAVFRGWADLLAELLTLGGVPADAAPGAAALLVAGSEGGVILSRAQSSIEPFEAVAGQLVAHVEALSRPAAD
ncbi:TetR/AcrR family transcriptional regulator [Leifsonia shinshuensis]|uniref:AcrR family transcriptional regulator n=1 Tax=Leifsonia shinshuensis TaxID=150026 RepID=A0A853CUF8_9MICO|nr:TetR/AcrR family transcriptional regulator [Leifsonia shinshuensis]NYJ22834.1 AcrR family transcriptional regulator [Leifsonia shinshuensis]